MLERRGLGEQVPDVADVADLALGGRDAPGELGVETLERLPQPRAGDTDATLEPLAAVALHRQPVDEILLGLARA